MNDLMPPRPGLSPDSGRTVVVKFDGSLLSSDGYILALREVGQSLCVSDHRPACVEDPNLPDRAPTVSLAYIIRFRSTMTAAGYEEGTTPLIHATIPCSRCSA
jgi:hypothetical protein